MSTYQINPTDSAVHFCLRHMNIANIRGEFGKVTGTVTYDPTNPGASQVDAAIDANTIFTRDERRDAHIKGGEFFDTDKHPTITFKSKRVTAAGKDTFSVAGDLTFRGVTKEVNLTVEGLSGEVKDMWGNLRLGAAAKTRINRKDFGMSFNAPVEGGGVLLSEEVDINIDIEMTRKAD